MKFLKIYQLIFFALAISPGFAQQVKRTFNIEEVDSVCYKALLQDYGKNKKLPEGFEKQSLVALSFFPELKETKIIFKLRKQTSPLMVRPTIGSTLFRSATKRTYKIFISSDSKIDSVIMKNLPFDAQIGVVGHELSHVAFFIEQNRLGMCRVAFGNFSTKYLDKLEFETDKVTIEHGLGWQLLVWSEYVRVKLKMERWKGEDEYIYGKTNRPRTRYMNPETIRAVIAAHPLYKTNKAETIK